MTYTAGSRGSPRDRFAAKYEAITETGCWLWTAAAGRYGSFSLNGMKPIDAHRAAWLLFCGDIPEGMRVLHRCDVPLCVNPAHLFLGTALDNTIDMVRKGRHGGKRRHDRRIQHGVR